MTPRACGVPLLLALALASGARAQDAARGALPAGVLLEAWRLSVGRDSFNVTIRGTLVGTQVTELRVDDGLLVYAEHTEIGMLALVQHTRVVMDPSTLAPTSMDQTGSVQEQQADTHVRMAEGRVQGRARTPGPGGQVRVTEVDTVFAPGTLDVNQLPIVIPALPLRDSASFTVSVFNAADASTTPYTIAVEVSEEVTVPAGTFSVYRVLLGKEGQPQLIVFVTRDYPRRIVKLEAAGQQIAFELVK
jgi:hypothetical protein